MDIFDDYTILVLLFVVFMLVFYPMWSEKVEDYDNNQIGRRRSGRSGRSGRRLHGNRRGRYGRRDYYGYYGDYWNVYNPWRINNPCASYAARKCRGNYYYEPCYDYTYFRCMNSTFYA